MINQILAIFMLPLSVQAKALLCYLVGIGDPPYPTTDELAQTLQVSGMQLLDAMVELRDQNILEGDPKTFIIKFNVKSKSAFMDLVKNAPNKSAAPKGVLELMNLFNLKVEETGQQTRKLTAQLSMVRHMVKHFGTEQLEKEMYSFFENQTWQRFQRIAGELTLQDFQRCLKKISISVKNPSRARIFKTKYN